MIREAQVEDLPRIIEMGSRSLLEGPYRTLLEDKPEVTLALAKNLVVMQNAKILVAEDDGHIGGVFAFIVFPHYYSGECVAGEIIWYVEPEHRSNGCGLELLWSAEKLAKQLGAKKMQLTAPTDEIAAMYKKLRGYKQIETSFQRTI